MRGWRVEPLGALCDIASGVTKDQKRVQTSMREVPYLRVANVQRLHLVLDDVRTIMASEREIETLALQPGDLLLNEGGDRDKLGRGWIWDGQIPLCIHQNHVFRARIRVEGLIPRWLAYFTNSSFAQTYFFGAGKQTTNLASISSTRLKGLPIPVPPLPEQHRIVAAIETHFSRLDAAVVALTRAKSNVKRARASVLKAAVEGRLVPTEAALARAEGRAYETGAALLARILDERREAWAASGGRGKYKEPVGIGGDGEVREVPEGWVWATVDELAGDGGRGLCDGPFGSNLKSAHYQDEGPRVVRLQNIGDGVFRDERAHITQPHFEALRKHEVRSGDLVIASLGETLPRACIIPEWLGEAIVKADCIRFSLANHVLATYLNIVLNSPPVRRRTTDRIHGIGRPRLGLGGIREISLPLPPLAEQHRIVAEVDRRLSVLDALDRSLAANLARCGRLRQAILKRAFEGRLVGVGASGGGVGLAEEAGT